MNIEFNSEIEVNKLPILGKLNLVQGINILTGSNGLGKSTLFHYIKSNKDSLLKKSSSSFMDQFPLAPLSELRVLDVLAIMDEDIHSFDLSFAKSLIEEFSLNYILSRSINVLSGGENQLLKFILAISNKSDLYFLDEPLQYLDGKNLDLVIKHIVELSKNSTVVIIEHRKELLQNQKAKWFVMSKKENSIYVNEGELSGI